MKLLGPAGPAWAWPALIAAAALLVYHPVLGFPYVWTDHAEIEDGRLVPRSLEELSRFLLLPKGAAKEASAGPRSLGPAPPGITYHRPLKALTYGLDHALGGGRPWSFHATNLALHLLACLLLYLLARRLLGAEQRALAGLLALWQALSPLHVETVAWVSARSDSLVAVAALLASLALLRGRTSRPWAWRLAAAALAGLGALSKESGLAIFPWLLGLSALWPDPARPGVLGRALRECAPALLAGLGLVSLRLFVVADLGALGQARTGLPAWTWLELLGDNLALSFAPLSLRLADSVHLRDGPGLAGLLGLAALLAWLGLGLWLRRRAPVMPLSALGWLLAWLPVSQLLPLLHARGERYLYLPSMFAGLLAAWALGLAWARLRMRAARLAVLSAGALCLLACGLWAHVRALDWADERRLFAAAVADEPACAECWNNLAYARAVAGDLHGSVQASRRALGVDRSRVRTYLDGYSVRYLLARASLELGQGEQAVPVLEELWVKAGPTPAVLGMLAEAYLQAGRPGHALAVLELLGPGDPRAAGHARLLERAVQAEVDSGFASLPSPLDCRP